MSRRSFSPVFPVGVDGPTSLYIKSQVIYNIAGSQIHSFAALVLF